MLILRIRRNKFALIKILVSIFFALGILSNVELRMVLNRSYGRKNVSTSPLYTVTSRNKIQDHPTTPPVGIRKALQWFPESKQNDISMSTSSEPYVINNLHVCASAKMIDVVFLVSSALDHLSHRTYIRQTWGNQSLYRPKEVRIVFMLGWTENDVMQKSVERENLYYSDLVQGKFTDNYQNLIDKTVLGLRWASENCRHGKLVVKVDDDVFVSVYNLLENALNTYSFRQMEMFCYARPIGYSFIHRDTGKWQLGYEYFKNMTHFPFVHCNGFFVVMTRTLVPVLYEAAKRTPILRLDDVWLTGILPTVTGNITVSNLDSLTYDEEYGFLCFSSTRKRCKLTAVVLSHNADRNKLWSIFKVNQIIE